MSISKELLQSLPGFDPYLQADGYRFDEQVSQDNIDWWEAELTFTQGSKAKQPFLLEPFQQATLANLTGWIDDEGDRRFRECFLYWPRKNGKSEFGAGIICLIMFTDKSDGAAGAQIYSAASARDQTKFVFVPVKRMIQNNERLMSRAQVYSKSVVYKDRVYHPLSSDAGTSHGSSTYLAVIDEVHTHKNPELINQIVTSTGERTQPLIIYSTTADFQRESKCNTLYNYACGVRDGTIHDPTFLPVIYEASTEDDWSSEEVWEKANPNYGVSINKEFLRKQAKRAKDEPSFENTFKRLHLNIQTEQSSRWLPIDEWDGCARDFDHAILDGRECFGGLDLAQTQDLAAFVLVFPIDDEYFFLPWFWCPQEPAETNENRHNLPYLTWAKQSHIELTPGRRIDYRYIRRRINETSQNYKIKEIAFDPYNASTLAMQLEEEDGFEMIQFRQGSLSFNEPMKQLMGEILDRKFVHDGHPVLRWNACNVSAKEDESGNIRPDKKHSSGKIDGIVAAIMAFGRCLAHEASPGGSVYDRPEKEVVII